MTVAVEGMEGDKAVSDLMTRVVGTHIQCRVSDYLRVRSRGICVGGTARLNEGVYFSFELGAK